MEKGGRPIYFLWWCVGIGLFLIFAAVIAVAFFGFRLSSSLASEVKNMTEPHITSFEDKFDIRVLEMKSNPGFLSERVHIRCENDMHASIWIGDLKKAGFIQTNGSSGEVFYREGQPEIVGQSSPVPANGKYSTCEFVFEVTTGKTNTVWHSKMLTETHGVFENEKSSDGVSTSLPLALTVSDIKTNWPGTYQRFSSIPLAKLGNYEILVTIK